jgi:hypothetical protein
MRRSETAGRDGESVDAEEKRYHPGVHVRISTKPDRAAHFTEGNARIDCRESGGATARHRSSRIDGQGDPQQTRRLCDHVAEFFVGDACLFDDPACSLGIELSSLGEPILRVVRFRSRRPMPPSSAPMRRDSVEFGIPRKSVARRKLRAFTISTKRAMSFR